jgi:hypothetical protein
VARGYPPPRKRRVEIRDRLGEDLRALVPHDEERVIGPMKPLGGEEALEAARIRPEKALVRRGHVAMGTNRIQVLRVHPRTLARSGAFIHQFIAAKVIRFCQ